MRWYSSLHIRAHLASFEYGRRDVVSSPYFNFQSQAYCSDRTGQMQDSETSLMTTPCLPCSLLLSSPDPFERAPWPVASKHLLCVLGAIEWQ